MIFSKGTPRKQPPEWIFGVEKLEVVKDYTYLGVTFKWSMGVLQPQWYRTFPSPILQTHS